MTLRWIATRVRLRRVRAVIAARRAELDAQAAKTERKAVDQTRRAAMLLAWERRRERVEAVGRDVEALGLGDAWRALPFKRQASFASGEAFADYAHNHPHVIVDAQRAAEAEVPAETEAEYEARRDVRFDTLVDVDFGTRMEVPF